MSKQHYPGMACGLLALVLAGACASFVQTPKQAAGVPTLGGSANADVGTTAPNEPSATVVNAAAQQAPICEATTSCAALDAEQILLDCVKKVPYTNVLVPQGTTFQVVDDSGNFSCIDSGVVVNGKEVLTCHGKELYSFQLKLSNPSCSSSLEVGTGQCQDGYGYDGANKCCAPVGSDGGTTVTVNLGACPLPGP